MASVPNNETYASSTNEIFPVKVAPAPTNISNVFHEVFPVKVAPGPTNVSNVFHEVFPVKVAPGPTNVSNVLHEVSPVKIAPVPTDVSNVIQEVSCGKEANVQTDKTPPTSGATASSLDLPLLLDTPIAADKDKSPPLGELGGLPVPAHSGPQGKLGVFDPPIGFAEQVGVSDATSGRQRTILGAPSFFRHSGHSGAIEVTQGAIEQQRVPNVTYGTQGHTKVLEVLDHVGSIDVANGPQAHFKPPVIPDLNLSPQGSISQSDKATVPHLNTPSSEKHVEDISGVQAEVELNTFFFFISLQRNELQLLYINIKIIRIWKQYVFLICIAWTFQYLHNLDAEAKLILSI